MPVCNINEIIDQESNFIVVISSQYEQGIKDSLSKYNLEIFEKPLYEAYIEQLLTFYIYKTTIINDRLDVYKWIREYAEEFEGKEKEILELLEDEQSKRIVTLRTQFYRTGNLKYIMEMPVDTNQYFNTEYYKNIGDNEIYVDCGAYIGDTVQEFIQCVNNHYDKIYAFEPDMGNYTKLVENVKTDSYQNIETYSIATGEKEGEIFFNECNTGGSYVSENGNRKVRVVKLDDFIHTKITWLKMDIEGAEMDTLRGAEKLILENKPKLAICIYHKCEDLFTIPQYLHSLVPEYKFKIRQHKYDLYDTVLYADI